MESDHEKVQGNMRYGESDLIRSAFLHLGDMRMENMKVSTSLSIAVERRYLAFLFQVGSAVES